VGLGEEEWRKRVREKVAKEIAEEAKQQLASGTEEPAGREGTGAPRSGAFAVSMEAKEDGSMSAISGALMILAVCLALSLMTDAAGLDVFGSLRIPEHPLELTTTCLSWTAVAVLLTCSAWDHLFFRSNSGPAQTLQAETMEAQYLMQGETPASLATAAAILAVAEGVVFRGLVLAVVADVFTGLSQLPGTVDLLSGGPWEEPSFSLLPAYRLPLQWMWPFVCVGASALEALIERLAQGRTFPSGQIDREYIGKLLAQSLQTQTTDVQLVSTDKSGQMVMRRGRKVVSAGKISLEGMQRAGEHFLSQLKQQGLLLRHVHAGPVVIFAKAMFLSSEAILCGNLLPSLVTGAAAEAVQAMLAQKYVRQRLESDGSGSSKPKPILVRERKSES